METKNEKGIRFSFFVRKFENEKGFGFSFASLKTKNEKGISYPIFVRKFENEKGKNGIYTDLLALSPLCLFRLLRSPAHFAARIKSRL